MGAALGRCARLLAAAVFGLFVSMSAEAQQTSTAAPPDAEHAAVDIMKFLGGGLLGLGLHESGHLVFDEVFDARPRLTGVHFGPVPFFAISHRSNLSPRREFTVSSAGFWVQEATNEWVVTRRPTIRAEHAWLAKGVVAFNVLNSIGYAMVAFAKAGPFERDTRGMADAIGVDERAIGLLVLTPALLDGYRYFRPDSPWAAWTSRAVKAGSVLLVIRRR
jgi:hypothetical protein